MCPACLLLSTTLYSQVRQEPILSIPNFGRKCENLLFCGVLSAGKIPRELGNLFTLETLDLSYNELIGESPLDLSFLFLHFWPFGFRRETDINGWCYQLQIRAQCTPRTQLLLLATRRWARCPKARVSSSSAARSDLRGERTHEQAQILPGGLLWNNCFATAFSQCFCINEIVPTTHTHTPGTYFF